MSIQAFLVREVQSFQGRVKMLCNLGKPDLKEGNIMTTKREISNHILRRILCSWTGNSLIWPILWAAIWSLHLHYCRSPFHFSRRWTSNVMPTANLMLVLFESRISHVLFSGKSVWFQGIRAFLAVCVCVYHWVTVHKTLRTEKCGSCFLFCLMNYAKYCFFWFIEVFKRSLIWPWEYFCFAK